MPELELAEPMTFDQATDQLYFWGSQRIEDRDRAFSDLLGWVAGRAVQGEPGAADTLRRIRERAER